ncbi:FKBP-type peptidyl-prolyl cis-trans isomerase [Streptomyces sp. 8K308]|uniref:FKBP-type peptidyl-prolyl cis-trans isomerase n=1 Tax=Streptomyces sp. 8K308 TaxID=2530388 RepID=UPI00104D9C00|nr:FKBP-type peptidyl-prolyl cis-trans isomerase [Streptomyces sp. 8K308]TDC23458.1 FKBP-type peptidyl-prolyl cis-trans isomerase [Streptomyces sp. 8K308]
MIPTSKRARRFVAVLAVPAILLPVAACGSEDEAGSSSGASGPAATVSGRPGEQPEITVDEDAAVADEIVSQVIDQGDGAEVQEGDFVRVNVVGRTIQGDMELINTWKSATGEEPATEEEGPRPQVIVQAGTESALPAAATEPLIGQPVGSRIQVEGNSVDMLGAAAQQGGIREDDGIVWVFDIAGAASVDPEAAAEGEQAAVEEGMPEVEAQAGEPATITVPEGQDPPTELREQVLIEGEGPEVTEGQALIVQYTGVIWDSGEQFDTSWDRESASAFQIGIGQVVQGWDQGLVGKRVGDRVLLVIPPDLGYGSEERGGIPADSTLVFVVDIVGAA